MNESTQSPEQDQPLAAESAQPATPAPPMPPVPPSLPHAVEGGSPSEPAVARVRLRERVLGMRAVAGVALATLILGGLGGTAIGAAAGDDSGDAGPGEHGFGGRLEGGPETRPGPGQQDQLPAPTLPESSS